MLIPKVFLYATQLGSYFSKALKWKPVKHLIWPQKDPSEPLKKQYHQNLSMSVMVTLLAMFLFANIKKNKTKNPEEKWSHQSSLPLICSAGRSVGRGLMRSLLSFKAGTNVNI